MNVTFSRRVPWKMGFYVFFILYILGDLYWCQGPIRRSVNARLNQEGLSEQAKEERKVVAQVYGDLITLDQLNTRMREDLYLRGKKEHHLSEQELKQAKLLSLGRMIDDSLLRLKTSVNDMRRPIDQEKLEHEWSEFQKRFSSKEAFLEALSSQGIDEATMKAQLAARQQQEIQITSVVGEAIKPSEEEMRSFYDFLKNKYTQNPPERRKAAHVFLSTLNKDRDIVENNAELMLNQYNEGMSFEGLAKSKSEDTQTASKGGDLGWITIDRPLPGGIEKSIMSIEDDRPVLLKSPLGFHLVQAGKKEIAPFPSYDELKPIIESTLSNLRRSEGLELYLEQIRAEARSQGRITIFTDRL